jgi:nicotinamide-nucleotide amidase
MTRNREEVADYLRRHDLRLSTAESCTAGLITSLLGEIEGSGDWLECGYVTYSPEAKQSLLGIREETIERCGLTSEEVATEMAVAALQRNRANISVSTTGVAGPADAPDGTRAGTVCFAWAHALGKAVVIYAKTEQFSGSRNEVRRRAAEYAISGLLDFHRRCTPP